MTDKIYQLFDAINRSGIDNSLWGVCEDVDDSHYEWGTVGVHRFTGKWLFVYTDEDGANPLEEWSMELSVPDYEMTLEQDGEETMNKSIVFYKLEG